jgi:hypothetical protein
LHCASEKGRFEILKYLIETCHVNQDAKANNAATALHFACSYGHLEIVKYLIETCRADTDTEDNNGSTALYFARVNGHLDIVQYIAVNALKKWWNDAAGWNDAAENVSSEMDAQQEEEIDVREAEIQKQDEVIHQLSQQVARLEKSRELQQRLLEQSDEIHDLKARLALLENRPSQ